MQKFNVYGDPNNKPRFSSDIIISSINNAAKKLNLYDENGLSVCYDTICNNHAKDPQAYICCYEFTPPSFILDKAAGKPIIAVSRDNAFFFAEAGYNPILINYANLGIDTSIWNYVEKKYMKDKFVVLSYTESLVRSGLEILIEGFGTYFCGNKDAVLYIKDRNATPLFESYVKERAAHYNIEIIYNNCHLETPEQEKEIFAHADCHFYLNRSTTFGMCVAQSMACGIPTVSPDYSGPREFINDKFSGLSCDYELEPITDELLNNLQSLGMRNYFFPIKQYHKNQPYWCKPKVQSVMNNLDILYKQPHMRKRLSFMGQQMASMMSWEKTATNISTILTKYY